MLAAEVHHEIAGEGQPVVLLHPGCADSRIFDSQWPRYTEHFRTLRLDMPGFGRSPIHSLPVTYAREVAQVIEKNDAAPTALVGLSLGGRVALELAVARPELVTALVLVAAALPHSLETSSFVARHTEELVGALRRGQLNAAVELSMRVWVDGPHRRPDEANPAMRHKMAIMQRKAFINMRAVAGAWREERLVSQLDRRLTEIRVPTLVLVGELDLDVVRRDARLLAAGIPGARLTTITRTAHVPNIERPDAFDALVIPFLTHSATYTQTP